jgi:hypothetical protein
MVGVNGITGDAIEDNKINEMKLNTLSKMKLH